MSRSRLENRRCGTCHDRQNAGRSRLLSGPLPTGTDPARSTAAGPGEAAAYGALAAALCTVRSLEHQTVRSTLSEVNSNVAT